MCVPYVAEAWAKGGGWKGRKRGCGDALRRGSLPGWAERERERAAAAWNWVGVCDARKCAACSVSGRSVRLVNDWSAAAHEEESLPPGRRSWAGFMYAGQGWRAFGAAVGRTWAAAWTEPQGRIVASAAGGSWFIGGEGPCGAFDRSLWRSGRDEHRRVCLNGPRPTTASGTSTFTPVCLPWMPWKPGPAGGRPQREQRRAAPKRGNLLPNSAGAGHTEEDGDAAQAGLVLAGFEGRLAAARDGVQGLAARLEYVKSSSVHAMHAAAAICLGRRGAGGTDASLGLPSCLPLKTMTRDQTTTAAPVHAGRDDAIRGAGRAGRRQLSRGFGAAGLEVERGPQLSLFECLDVLNLDAVLSQAFPPLTPSLPPVEKHRGVLEWGVKRARASARRPEGERQGKELLSPSRGEGRRSKAVAFALAATVLALAYRAFIHPSIHPSIHACTPALNVIIMSLPTGLRGILIHTTYYYRREANNCRVTEGRGGGAATETATTQRRDATQRGEEEAMQCKPPCDPFLPSAQSADPEQGLVTRFASGRSLPAGVLSCVCTLTRSAHVVLPPLSKVQDWAFWGGFRFVSSRWAALPPPTHTSARWADPARPLSSPTIPGVPVPLSLDVTDSHGHDAPTSTTTATPRTNNDGRLKQAAQSDSHDEEGEQHRRRLVDALVALHVACIQFDGALMRFHPPFGAAQWQRMRLFWDERVAQAEAGRRVVLLALPAAASVPAPVPVPGAGADVNAGGGGVGGVGLGAGDGASEHQGSGNHDANDNDVNAGIDIAGVVELATPDTDTGPFRADVEMLMVSPDHRRAGLGKRLMAAVEDAGRQRGRTLLQLSTTAGSVAEERLYPALGYTKVRPSRLSQNVLSLAPPQPRPDPHARHVPPSLPLPPMPFSVSCVRKKYRLMFAADFKNQLGTVPNYGISPVDGQLVDGVYFYKDLSRPPTGV
ncbi:hypothetical protein Purlil1_5495 [Purpureocillium lilacinum]|uniref:N-acetyltransferase domain-containing protein n=1 Tax=Purpureocillium lilacinum TaxID=33203 RepID=A0ABR0C1V9_PURLI|nr:hypothetical protein Purlil1_5495 [Purpureocillium lilacinum]